jgi:hypothetical protein
MKFGFVRLTVVSLLLSSALHAEDTNTAASRAQPAFALNGVGYFHRWSKNGQHEFTPAGQEDLKKWTEMVTVNVYPDAHEGENLAAKANAVVENYKSHQAKILKTNSIPRTPDRPAEHLIVAVFGRPNFIEAAFARFKLIDGTGCSLVYSHRIYGDKIGDKMSEWLKANGSEAEKALLQWTAPPSPKALSLEVL